MRCLSCCQRLTHLTLATTDLKTLQILAACQAPITTLKLNMHFAREPWKPVADFDQLSWPQLLTEIDDLDALRLSHADLAPLAELTQLTELDFGRQCDAKGKDLWPLLGLPLKAINFGRCPRIMDDAMKILSRISSLNCIRMTKSGFGGPRNSVTNIGLCFLQNLTMVRAAL